MALLRVTLALALLAAPFARAQEETPPPEPASKPPVAIPFTPPDLDGRIILGIFDAAGKLVRTLHPQPGAPDLVIALNGYIAQWDGRDEHGAPCPAGRYSAHGYIVGNDVAAEGEAFHFNDWLAEDGIPATGVKLCQWPDAVGVEIRTPAQSIFAKIGLDGALAKSPPPAPAAPTATPAASPQFGPSPVDWSPGRDGTAWLIIEDGGQHVVIQLSKDGKPERELRVPLDEPQPADVLAVPGGDAILLLETAADGRQRVRMLSRSGARQEQQDGRVVTDWEVVFERSLQPCANFGIIDAKLVADAGASPQNDAITVPLVENELQPGKPQSLRLRAVATQSGSALVSPDGLRLLEISGEGSWSRFALVPAEGNRAAALYQGDGLVVEEYSLSHLESIAAFDAGSFLLAPAAQ
jgi:hypothetical protein